MKKIQAFIVLGLIFTAIILSGCEEHTIEYEGEIRSMSEVAEILEEKLEEQNPDIDLDVTVSEDSD